MFSDELPIQAKMYEYRTKRSDLKDGGGGYHPQAYTWELICMKEQRYNFKVAKDHRLI